MKRSENYIGAHIAYRERPLDYYKLGLEVVRNVYIFANCDSLVCGLSKVSFAAQYVNIALNRKFKKIAVWDNGINTKDFVEAKKKASYKYFLGISLNCLAVAGL